MGAQSFSWFCHEAAHVRHFQHCLIKVLEEFEKKWSVFYIIIDDESLNTSDVGAVSASNQPAEKCE